MKILVTGGAGFIGSAFVRHVLATDEHIRVVTLDKLTYAGNMDNLASVAGNAQPSNGLVTTPVASTETAPVGIARPSAAEMVSPRSPNPPSAEPTPPARVEPSVARVASVPSAPAAAAESAAPGPRTGKIRLSIRPWGEVVVDGKSKGVSPPLKELSIPEGRHRIQIRNGDFAGYDSELDVKAGSKDEIAYSFKAP